LSFSQDQDDLQEAKQTLVVAGFFLSSFNEQRIFLNYMTAGIGQLLNYLRDGTESGFLSGLKFILPAMFKTGFQATQTPIQWKSSVF
jgi:hypothetical protein